LYVLAQGRLAIVASNGHGEAELTVRTLMPGSTVGEMGVFRQQARTTTVRAEVDTVVLKLSATRLAELEATDPAVAAALYRLFIRQMANRVDQLTAQAHLLSR
jgi:SulP family sulfate permease